MKKMRIKDVIWTTQSNMGGASLWQIGDNVRILCAVLYSLNCVKF